MKYRPEIDGLRALAVIPVILFHADFHLFSGGYIGVDIFFVISGYLITTILLEDLKNNNFSLSHFYERRARRILPPLFLLIFCTSVVAWFCMLPYQLVDFGKSIVAVIFFVSNIFFWSESGYFSVAAEQLPLLHTWSLAVEEQYYMLFPFILLFAWRFIKTKTIILFTLCLILSLGLAQWGSIHAPAANFYFLPTRAWELLTGSLVASYLLLNPTPLKLNNNLRCLGSGIGFTMIVFSIFYFDKTTPFPSAWGLIPVLGTSLIILFGGGNNAIGQLLSFKPIVGIGLISYSLYLYHQPLFAFARILSPSQPSPALFGGLIILSALLAWLSWHFVEKIFRDKYRFNRTQVFAGSLIVILMLTFTGIFLQQKDGFINRYPIYQHSWIEKTHNEHGKFVTSFYKHEIQNKPFLAHKKKLLIVGDSYSQDFYNMIRSTQIFSDYSISSIFIDRPCQFYIGNENIDEFIPKKDIKHCKELDTQMPSLIEKAKKSDILIFAFSWQEWAAKRLENSLDKLNLNEDKKVIILGSKVFNYDIRQLLLLDQSELQNVRGNIPKQLISTNQILKEKAQSHHFINLFEKICGESHNCPILTPSGKLISYDHSHLTPAGAKHLGKIIFDQDFLNLLLIKDKH